MATVVGCDGLYERAYVHTPLSCNSPDGASIQIVLTSTCTSDDSGIEPSSSIWSTPVIHLDYEEHVWIGPI